MKIGDKVWCSDHFRGDTVSLATVIAAGPNRKITAVLDGKRFIIRGWLYPTKLEALEDKACFIMEEQELLQEQIKYLAKYLLSIQGQIYEETV